MWRCTSNPLHALVVCIWTMSVEIRDSKLQEDRETSKVWKLKMFFAIIFITVHIEAWWAGLAECGGWRADW